MKYNMGKVLNNCLTGFARLVEEKNKLTCYYGIHW